MSVVFELALVLHYHQRLLHHIEEATRQHSPSRVGDRCCPNGAAYDHVRGLLRTENDAGEMTEESGRGFPAESADRGQWAAASRDAVENASASGTGAEEADLRHETVQAPDEHHHRRHQRHHRHPDICRDLRLRIGVFEKKRGQPPQKEVLLKGVGCRRLSPNLSTCPRAF